MTSHIVTKTLSITSGVSLAYWMEYLTMAEFSCCGEYNEHAKDCITIRVKALESKLQIAREALEQIAKGGLLDRGTWVAKSTLEKLGG